jgi:uncharacterized protein (DUF1778 family)
MRSKTFSVRFDSSELAQVAFAASLAREKLTPFIRQAALLAATRTIARAMQSDATGEQARPADRTEKGEAEV